MHGIGSEIPTSYHTIIFSPHHISPLFYSPFILPSHIFPRQMKWERCNYVVMHSGVSVLICVRVWWVWMAVFMPWELARERREGREEKRDGIVRERAES